MAGTERLGPFTLEELQERKLTRETPVWYHELLDWQSAGTIPELRALFSMTPPPIQNPTYTQPTAQIVSRSNSMDTYVFLALAYWFITSLINLVIRTTIDDWFDSPAKFIQIGTNLIFAVVPLVIALSIKDRALKTPAIIFGVLLSLYILYNNLDWLIREF